MKKHSIILILALSSLFAFSQNSATISNPELIQAAEKFTGERFQQTKDVIALHDIGIQKNTLYIAELKDKGFVLLSGFKQIKPILAYSEESKIDLNSIPENFAAWILQYEKQLQYALENTEIKNPSAENEWNYLLGDQKLNHYKAGADRQVEPLTQSTWDQSFPYNQQCPADPDGPSGHCVTGCVATTLAQLMYYYRFPQQGTGSYSYDCPPYGTLSADFGNSTYNWDEMVNHPTTKNPAIAQLMNHLGISVDMVYGPDGSGMYNHKAGYTLRTFFKYSPESHYIFRDSTSLDWKELLISHLDKKMPLYYAGWSVPNIMGHAFICDGYQTDEYYHFNWGWGSSWDGYFYIDTLVVGGNSFELAQEIVANAFPDTINYQYPYWPEPTNLLTNFDGSITDGSGPIYPYKNNTDVQWLIDPQTEFDSVSSLQLSFNYFSTESENDLLIIYDGETSEANVLASLSGDLNSNLPVINSTGNKVLVRFISNESITEDGWMLSYKSTRPEWCSSMTILTDPAGEISDGSGRFYYENNSLCKWNISTNSELLELSFSSFETESEKDVVKIYEFPTMEVLGELSGSFSAGNLPGPFISTTGQMFITFQTNNNTRLQGWTAYYQGAVNIEDGTFDETVKIFPNPANTLVRIQYSGSGSYKASIYSADGSKLMQRTFSEKGVQTLDCSEIPTGVYFLQISDRSNIHTKKLLIH